MKRFFLWISFLLFVVSATAQDVAPTNPLFSFNEEGKGEYSLTIHFKKSDISGLCVLKNNENGLAGSVFNEFGIKAFDIIYKTDNQKVTLLNVISFLNKWYIKRVVKADWRFLFSYPNIKKKDKTRKLTFEDDNRIVLENLKYQTIYTFVPLSQDKTKLHEAAE